MRKVLGLVVSLAALTFTVAAAQAKDQIRVVVGFYSAATQGIFEGMAKDFTAAHPDVDVKIEVVRGTICSSASPLTSQANPARYRSDWDPVAGRLRAQRHRRTAGRLYYAGIQEPLHRKLHGPLDNQRQSLRPSRRGVCAGHVLQQDLLAKAGIQNPPDTWDQLVDDAKKIEARSEAATLTALRCRARKSRPTPTGVLFSVDPRRRADPGRQVGSGKPLRDRRPPALSRT